MRFELALAVGIIFFCSWCAYIIIRMNSSLTQHQELQPNNITGTSGPGSGYPVYSPERGAANSMPVRDHYYQSSQSHPNGKEQTNHRYTGADMQQQLQFGGQPPSQAGPYYPTTLSGQDQAASEPNYARAASGTRRQAGLEASLSGHPAASEANIQDQYQDQDQDQDHDQEQDRVLEKEKKRDRDKEEQEEPEEDTDETPGGDGDQPTDDVDPLATRRQSEQLEAGRSFSQDEVDSTERDRFGNPVRAYRRHLINGKAVQPVGGQPGGPGSGADLDFDKVVDEIEGDGLAEGGQEDESPDDEQANKPQQQDEQPTDDTPIDQEHSQQPEESRRLSAISGRKLDGLTGGTAKRRTRARPDLGTPEPEEIDEHSKDNLPPLKVKDLHQHKMKESLQAQQWDDDTATSPSEQDDDDGAGGGDVDVDAAAARRNLANGGDSNPEATLEAIGSSVGQKQKPETRTNKLDNRDLGRSDIAFQDLDLLSDGRFPFLESNSEPENALGQQEDSDDQEGDQRRVKRGLKLIRAKRSELDEGKRVERKLNSKNDSSQPTQLQNLNDNGNWILELGHDDNNNITGIQGDGLMDDSQMVTKNQQHPSERANNGRSNRAQTAAGGSDGKFDRANVSGLVNKLGADLMKEQEDMIVEVSADPPTLGNRHPIDAGTMATVNQTSHYPSWPPQPNNGHSSGPHLDIDPKQVVAGPRAPQVGQFDAAQGRQVPSDSKLKGKRKKKAKTQSSHIKKSKVNGSKYQAAKAASMKRNSRVKKGGLDKKKLKKGKKYSKSYKDFKGSTRGKKGAKGVGLRGSKKGALYYKDKGYKKRGFKKAYQKLESGDHKTYFDEFRDKDHSKKWKDFKDKHHYRKKYNNMSARALKDKKYRSGKWRQKEQSKFRKDYRKRANSESMEKEKEKQKTAKKHHKKY